MYQFLPSPDYIGKEENWICIDNFFSEEELKLIDKIGSNLNLNESTLMGNVIDKGIRSCKVSWIGFNEESKFIYEKLSELVVKINQCHFGFNLTGFIEHFQYTLYEPNNDHYEWHMDKGFATLPPRKLSLVLMLSNPDEYEGGDLEFLPGSNVTVTEKKFGRIFIFPSWLLHRVTPVTKGIRKTLVVWVSGPKFI